MLKNKKIGFIGGGNMAEAIIKGMLSSSLVKVSNVFVSEPNKNRQIFSLSKMKETISGTEYKQKMEEGSSNPSKNVGYKQLEQPSMSTNEKSISTEVTNHFMTYILNLKELESLKI